MQVISEHASFGGVQGYYRHDSVAIGLPMKFAVYRPPIAATQRVPALFFLAGLTCTEETFAIKAGAQRTAAALGLMLVSPDTSPRNTGIDGATADWDFGEGAGFYLDATEVPWNRHFKMESWIVRELRELIVSRFPVDAQRVGIFGHSMGGHGALTLALKHPGLFRSVSAFAPIAAPSDCPWGNKAFSRYLGADRKTWASHDASERMRCHIGAAAPFPAGILIDQGGADKFLAEGQLHPESFAAACQAVGQPLTLRRHVGYDHGYFFVSTFIDDHLRFHHAALSGEEISH
jgi:S-formylglutathione hydrolase